jgi:excinuclease ABC subunit A
MKSITIIGAKQHNLKNISLEIPRDQLVVITGPSGSGKSTLAFDTLYAEGQRRYVESLSAYARQFLGLMSKPDVERIDGLSPAISIEQKTTSKNPRSTVGTVTEIFDHLRLLFARIGVPHCPDHGVSIEAKSAERICQDIVENQTGTVTVLAPVIRKKKGTHEKVVSDLLRDGFVRVRINGTIQRSDEPFTLERYKQHNIDVVVDRTDLSKRSRLEAAVETALRLADGLVIILAEDGSETIFSDKMACPHCSFTMEELQPRMFSFNSPFGACEACHGLGVRMDFDTDLIIPDRRLSIADGALAIYRNAVDGWRGQYVAAVAEHFGFDVDTPVEKLDERQYNALMYGSAETIHFSMKMKHGEAHWSHNGQWEGLVPQAERLYAQTDSEYRRSELEKYMRVSPCPDCGGKRLSPKALAVKIDGQSISDVTELSIRDARRYFAEFTLTSRQQEIARQLLKEIESRLLFLDHVGLGYIALSRNMSTLSGGEAQRIRLATQIGSNLMGVLYILDEPTIGLHPRDNARLIETLKRLRDIGNTLIVVEHDEEMMRSADHIIDMGPGAGREGGEVVCQGNLGQILACPASITGAYLSGRQSIPVPPKRRKPTGWIRLKGCRRHNLQGIDVDIPQGVMTVLTGVSGSGKSTLMYEMLHAGLQHRLKRQSGPLPQLDSIENDQSVDQMIVIDQSPIGRTPRSNPATYTKLFDEIRNIFAATREAKIRGYKPGRFSFNVSGGRCESCHGDGVIKIEMNFLPDVYIECEECKGKRYNHETLSVHYKDHNIAQVLALSVDEAVELFSALPGISRKLTTLQKVGLGYIQLGQSATTLSGGEAQRIKLTRELAKKSTTQTLYLLDEPTTGLHFEDVAKLIAVLNFLVDKGASVVVIEHNLDVIKCADHLIDLGPEGGDLGGQVIATGTPEKLARHETSFTGEYLRKVLGVAAK